MPPHRPTREALMEAQKAIDHFNTYTGAADFLEIPRTTLQVWVRDGARWYPGLKMRGPTERTLMGRALPEPPPPSDEKPKVRVFPPGKAVKVLAIGDAHDSPKLDKQRFHWIGRLAADVRPEWIVQIGDFFTMDSLNSHDGNETFNGRAKPAFMDDIVSGKEALDAFNTALPTDYHPNRHITLGNHEARVWRYENEAPETHGMMQHELGSMLEGAGWKWSRYGEWLFLGGVGFIHVPLNRMGRPYGGKTAENQIANDALFDVCFGHSHVARRHRAPKIGPAQHVTILNLGCALPHGHIEEYAQHSTTGWDFGVHMLTLSNGHIEGDEFVSMLELERRYGR